MSRGRGQVVRLLWENAGIAYQDIRYSNEELQDPKEAVIPRKNPVKTLSVVKLNGKILTQSYTILHRLAKLLGEYDGETEEKDTRLVSYTTLGLIVSCLFISKNFL